MSRGAMWVRNRAPYARYVYRGHFQRFAYALVIGFLRARANDEIAEVVARWLESDAGVAFLTGHATLDFSTTITVG